MKKSELLLNLISIPVDAIMLLCAGIVSFYSRQQTFIISKPIIYQLQLNEFLLVAGKIIPALLVIFALIGLYNVRGTAKFSQRFGKVVIGTSLGLLLVILLFFFNQSIFPSRFIILAPWGLGIVFVTLGRLLIRAVQQFLFMRGIGLHHLVIVNGGEHEAEVIESVYKNKSYGYQVVKELRYSENIFGELNALYERASIDEILQANAALSDEENWKLVQFARNKGIEFSFVPNLFEVQRNNVETYAIKGVPVIQLKNTPLDGWGKVAKRILDIAASSVCLIITSPVFLIVAIAIKLDSAGKVIYSALRGGCGRDFMFYKFRTMYSHLSVGDGYGGREAEKIRQELWKQNSRGGESGPLLKIKDDPRVTRVGRFLRKTKLDEIPQFWNVLKGDMSMVGPRAHVLDEVGR
ncbi:MAG TPA: sugar transferase, partial [Patescibacteria group bacterium]|nr:sugar transferase [Patescibacteria group bacterium]